MQLNFNDIFPDFPDSSRVWLYLANRKLDSTELFFAKEQLKRFLGTWKAHGKSLNCDGTILFSQYLVLCANEDFVSASGCSIDSSVHFVKSLGNELHVDFFNRMNVLIFEGENQTKLANYTDAIRENSPFLNPTIEKLGELRTNWINSR